MSFFKLSIACGLLVVSLLTSFYAIGTETAPFEPTKNLPIAFQGRFRSLDAVARLWLYDYYHSESIKNEDLVTSKIQDSQALELLWRTHFLHKLQDYDSLNGTSLSKEEEYANAFHQLNGLGTPPNEIARKLEEQFPLQKRLKQAGTTLKMLPSQHFQGEWLSLHALKVVLYDPLSNALAPLKNFTAFSDEQYAEISSSYAELERIATNFFNTGHVTHRQLERSAEKFAKAMAAAYKSIAETPYKEALGKNLYYPSLEQLKAETMYYRLPLIGISLAGYALALLLFFTATSLKRNYVDILAWGILVVAFVVHTAMLALRCYVLQRPPVSNMFETVIYVPWIAMGISLCLQKFMKSRIPVMAACIASLALLILVKLSHANSRMENVQAVLDSQYWLIVHVLLVVGSYGVFIISGLLGHYYLFAWGRKRKSNSALHLIARCVLQTMYIGVALLIPGTILGGVWAAESWGRFWDWDPKESWAFISACVYLLIIHAYTFCKIQDLGLAVGSIAGLIAISFTWYGVNYILGTGLHSYGFGNGGEVYYFGYIGIELLIIGYIGYTSARTRILIKNTR